jgi:hypothetical protein
MSKSKKPKGPTKAERRTKNIQALVTTAKAQRADNRQLLRDLREDPSLAEDIKFALIQDLIRVSEIPRDILGPSSSRDRYRQLGHYSTSLVDFCFGLWAEFQRKAGLAETLATRTVKRNISKTSRAQDLARYADSNVLPWNDAHRKLRIGKKPITMVIGSDFHSHFCNPFALRVWNDIIKDLQPDAIRLNGDLVDFPSLSTHRNFPGHFPMTVQDEIDWAVNKVIAPARKNAPKADIRFLIGNHDVRLITAMADKGPMFASLRSLSFADQFKLDKYEVGLVCRSNFLHLSANQRSRDIAQNWETLVGPDGTMLWTTVHGWLCGKDAPRKHMLRFMTNGTNGHLHDRQRVSAGSYATGVHDWFQTSCMAHPEAVAAGYIHGPVEFNGWTCGFLVTTIYPDTGHVSGEFVEVGNDIATFRGKVWKIRQYERDQIAAMLDI